VGFSAGPEGVVPWMYADILGLVTTGIGNLIDPPSAALGLPWVVAATGQIATVADVMRDWHRVKNDPSLRTLGHRACEHITALRLTDEGVDFVVARTLEANDVALSRRIPDWEDLPACAQLAMHSLAWACGPHANFPALFSAVNAGDFDAAAVHIAINEWSQRPDGTRVRNAGLVPRNAANRVLMRNASRVQGYHLDPDLIDWTHDLAVTDAPTVPALPESETGSGPIIHPLSYGEPDDVA
jgi:GH24 family phage-related lysozyme (muramidase)